VGGEQTYEAAGVSIAKADAVVERLRAAVESTGVDRFGAFAGLYPLDGERLLAASTDSVGTKLILARERGALRACGADLAAHCVNDVITTGADPLFLLDYVAANRIDLDAVAELVEELSAHSPLALAMAKRVLNTAYDGPLNVGLELEGLAYGLLRQTHDFREGVEAFVEKRRPEFTGE